MAQVFFFSSRLTATQIPDEAWVVQERQPAFRPICHINMSPNSSPDRERSREADQRRRNWLLSPLDPSYDQSLDDHLVASDVSDDDDEAKDDHSQGPYEEPSTPNTGRTGRNLFNFSPKSPGRSAAQTILTSPQSPTFEPFAGNGQKRLVDTPPVSPHPVDGDHVHGSQDGFVLGSGGDEAEMIEPSLSDEEDPNLSPDENDFAKTEHGAWLEIAASGGRIDGEAARDGHGRRELSSQSHSQNRGCETIRETMDELESEQEGSCRKASTAMDRDHVTEEAWKEAMHYVHVYPPWQAIPGDSRCQRYVIRVPRSDKPDAGDPGAVETVFGWSDYQGNVLPEHQYLREGGNPLQYLPGNPGSLAEAKELFINTLEEKTLHLQTIANWYKQEALRRKTQEEFDQAASEVYSTAENDYKSQMQDLETRVHDLENDLQQKSRTLELSNKSQAEVDAARLDEQIQYDEGSGRLRDKVKSLESRVRDLKVEKEDYKQATAKTIGQMEEARQKEVQDLVEEKAEQSKCIDDLYERLDDMEKTCAYFASHITQSGMDHLANPVAHLAAEFLNQHSGIFPALNSPSLATLLD